LDVIQVNPQNIDQLIAQVEHQQKAVDERYDTLRDMQDALKAGDLLAAAKVWVESQLAQVNADTQIVQANLDQLREAKQRMSSGIVLPTGPIPPPNSVSLK
jgi:chromosome segregation ATPase